MATPNHILRGRGCPLCKGGIKKTHEQYVTEVASVNPNIEVLGGYINSNTKILHKCKIDGHEWKAFPFSILYGHGCPKCTKHYTRTQEEYIQELAIICPDIEVLGKYIKSHEKILHRCKICGHKWETKPNDTLNGHGCPICANVHRVIGDAPEYRNSIWASEYKDLFSKCLTEDQMKTNMPNSKKKIDMTCPDCGRHKMCSPYTVVSYRFSCVCSDGLSYPNKFMYGLLNQLKIEYETEKRFSWSNRKCYDIYIPSISCIIENHGGQHYDRGFKGIGGKTLEQEQENDAYKKELAIHNGIKYYIELDCRESSIAWIKKSILNSKLVELFCINEIDWEKCGEFALSNMVKSAAKLWNDGYSTKEISKKIKVVKATVLNYLKKANECGLCNYTKEEAMKRRDFSNIKKIKEIN